jgi:hypothetical protein
MNSQHLFNGLRERIQQDVNNRGLARDPAGNLFSACPDDLRKASSSLVAMFDPVVAVVTGFYIPAADPPAFETDGPLGAVFLARALGPLGIPVVLVSDEGCLPALRIGLEAAGREDVPVVDLAAPWPAHLPRPTNLVAIERVGPNHTEESIRASPGAFPEVIDAFLAEVSPERRGRCYSMRGRDITEHTGPGHVLFERSPEQRRDLITIGIGDGGNEIGMGKVPWEVIHRNIPRGGLIACRVPTDYLIVAGVSNWGAYALGAGVALQREGALPADLFDPDREADILRAMVERGPLVDGVLGRPSLTVDGLAFDEYVTPLVEVGRWLEEAR